MDALDVRAVVEELTSTAQLQCTVEVLCPDGELPVVRAQLMATRDPSPFALIGSEGAAGVFRGLRDHLRGEPWWVLADMAGEGLVDLADADPETIRSQSESVDARSLYANAELFEGVFPLPPGPLPPPGPPRPSPFIPGPVPVDDWGFSFAVMQGQENWWVAAALAIDVGHEPAEHAAVARDWGERFGAELVEYTHRSVTFAVPEPIADEDIAKQVALEHLGYGGLDLINSRTVFSLEEAAADLMVSTVWPFWWD